MRSPGPTWHLNIAAQFPKLWCKTLQIEREVHVRLCFEDTVKNNGVNGMLTNRLCLVPQVEKRMSEKRHCKKFCVKEADEANKLTFKQVGHEVDFSEGR